MGDYQMTQAEAMRAQAENTARLADTMAEEAERNRQINAMREEEKALAVSWNERNCASAEKQATALASIASSLTEILRVVVEEQKRNA